MLSNLNEAKKEIKHLRDEEIKKNPILASNLRSSHITVSSEASVSEQLSDLSLIPENELILGNRLEYFLSKQLNKEKINLDTLITVEELSSDVVVCIKNSLFKT